MLKDTDLAFAAASTNRTTYVKNLVLENTPVGSNQLNLGAPQRITYWKLISRDFVKDVNGMGTPSYEGAAGPALVGPASLTFSMVNMLLSASGGTALKHPIYAHGRPNGFLNVNNLNIEGGRGSSGLKSTVYKNRIRNTHVQVSKDPKQHDDTARLVKLIDIVSATDTAIYNVKLVGAKEAAQYNGTTQMLYWRARRSLFGAEIPPPPDTQDTPPYATAVSGGGYPPPGGLPDGWPSTPDTYMDPQFWTAVKAKPIADHTNGYTFKKYVAYTKFVWLFRGSRAYTAYRDDGTWPGYTYVTDSTGPWPIVTSPYWVERSAVFMANNSYEGWLTSDLTANVGTDFRHLDWEPEIGNSPNQYYGQGAGPWPKVSYPVTFDRLPNHSYLGGDTGPHPEADVGVDGDGKPLGPPKHVELPPWFEM